MILIFLQHRALRSYVTDHTATMAIRNKLRSTQFPKMRPKQRLRLKALSLHFLVSFVWRNVHQFVFRGRTHIGHKIEHHNMIATYIIFLFSNRFSNQFRVQRMFWSLGSLRELSKEAGKAWWMQSGVLQDSVSQRRQRFGVISLEKEAWKAQVYWVDQV